MSGIKNQDLWDFIQEHKNKTQEEFAGWLIGQQSLKESKIHKAITKYNNLVFSGEIKEDLQ